MNFPPPILPKSRRTTPRPYTLYGNDYHKPSSFIIKRAYSDSRLLISKEKKRYIFRASRVFDAYLFKFAHKHQLKRLKDLENVVCEISWFNGPRVMLPSFSFSFRKSKHA